MERSLGFRIFKEKISKFRTKRLMLDTWGTIYGVESAKDPVLVGKFTSTHRKPCSCSSCCSRRRNRFLKGKERLSLSEKRAELSQLEQIA